MKNQLLYWSTIAINIAVVKKGYFVLGYTKSGTNWLCSLLSEYFDLPIHSPWLDSFPKFEPLIFHMHRIIPIKEVKNRTVYMYRDGRDAFISRYHTMVKQNTQLKERKNFTKFLGKEPKIEEINENMTYWINYLKDNKSSSIDWKRHIEIGIDQFPITLKFEDLKKDGVKSMKDIISNLTNETCDENKIHGVLNNNEIQKLKKLKKNDSYAMSFIRKGISGEWKHVFNKEARELFFEYAGETLIKAGYEKDNSWVTEIE